MFTFGVKGGYEAGVKLVSSVKLLSHLANIGDTRSLIIHPASTTHSQLGEEELLSAGAGPDVFFTGRVRQGDGAWRALVHARREADGGGRARVRRAWKKVMAWPQQEQVTGCLSGSCRTAPPARSRCRTLA